MYDYTRARPNTTLLSTEIDADGTLSGGGRTVDSISWAGPDKLTIVMDAALSAGEKTALDAVVAAHDTLATYKAAKIAEVDAETHRRISLGFTHNATLFSLSMEAQTNWLGLKAFSSDFTYPLDVSAKDESIYAIADETEALTMAAVAAGTKDAHLSPGRTVKAAVLAAADEAAVDAAAAAWLA